ncbi:MAG: DNA polymerase zeta catalytic subunit, partial [Paramarteilia canceri]
IDNDEQMKSKLCAELKKTLESELKKSAPEWKQNYTQYIHSVSLKNALNFYGYHTKESRFFKIELADYNFIAITANIARKMCLINNLYLEPFESHITYDMKFLTDYNLRGMHFVKINKVSSLRSNRSSKED